MRNRELIINTGRNVNSMNSYNDDFSSHCLIFDLLILSSWVSLITNAFFSLSALTLEEETVLEFHRVLAATKKKPDVKFRT